ncbi:MAG TPA: PLD nuclease N-terminal domain-containing protein [Cyclobacteriaceae bacterium]|nr:PLD nuclease N-terminal domain-containing protein [Cyclobacteriaceae bacterium]HRJ83883.1 PLD nuclease N-terminal domain-containing protein [Cyclobacteriaceae bacterium]
MGRLWVLLIFVIDVLAILDVWKREYSMEKRLLWTVVIILLPLVGPVAWYLISRKIINI